MKPNAGRDIGYKKNRGKMFNHSIQKRLSLGLIIVLILTGLLLAQVSIWLMDQGLRRYLQSQLLNETQTLVSALTRVGQTIALDEKRISAAYHRPFSGEYFLIDLPGEQIRSRSLWDFTLDAPGNSGLHYKLVDGPGTQQLLIYSTSFRRFGKNITIAAARDYTPMLQAFRRVQLVGAMIGLLALILLVLMQRYLVKRAFQPLENMRKQIEQLQQGERSLLDAQVANELSPLVTQINHLLQHTENTLYRSRIALGNLGHALKTPLAVLYSILNRPELQNYPELQHDLNQQLQQIRERLSHELGRARLSGEALPGAYFNCGEEIPDLCTTLQKIYGEHVQINWNIAEGLKLPWDREDMLELLGNLLDNACKWAKEQVQLQIKQSNMNYEIIIDDDGPGVPPALREQVLRRGVRIDEQVQGHGLGLGIVKDIVEQCKGELELVTSPLQGLRVVIKLPTKPDQHNHK